MSGVIACIPARFGSTRLPGKPLLPVDGEPMIAHVVRAARAARSVGRVLVGTDHAGVAAAARAAGAEAVMTDPALPSGTDRVAAALAAVGASAEIVVNVQGDEPRVAPSAIDAVVGVMRAAPRADVGTLSAPLPAGALLDASRVKVVCRRDDGDGDGVWRALYFSRAPIGADREALGALLGGGGGGSADDAFAPPLCRLHVGLYAFRAAALRRFVALPPSALERVERLEQLRALEAGMAIAVGEVDGHAPGVDTPGDMLRAQSAVR